MFGGVGCYGERVPRCDHLFHFCQDGFRCQAFSECLLFHVLDELDGFDLVGACLLAFVAADALPYVRVSGGGFGSEAVVYISVRRLELSVVLYRAAVTVKDAADAAF